MQDVVNSKQVNQTLLNACSDLFELEYEIKMKAQLKYLEKKDKESGRKGFMHALRHDYLWTPTTSFYLGSLIAFTIVRRQFSLQAINVIPFMMIPVTMDYMKRDHYTSQFK